MGRKATMARAAGSQSKRNAANLYLVETDQQIEASRSRKTWSQRDCIDVKPLTDRQQDAFRFWFQREESSLALTGSAGTGKTLLACYLGINEVLNPNTEQKQLIIVRSAVETRSQGFLPGTKEEKEAVYQLPYVDAFGKLFKRSATYQDMVDAGIIKFVTTSHVRGLTFDNSIVIIDESQNLSFHELSSVITRVGNNTRLIILGDTNQNDLHAKRGTEVSGFADAIRILKSLNDFDVVTFTHDDIVRSKMVKDWIIACERLNL